MTNRAFGPLAAALLATAACDLGESTPPPTGPTLDADLRARFAQFAVVPIGSVAQQNPALVTLGQMLVFDRILSGNRDISCATCHDPATHGADGLSLMVGTSGTGTGTGRMPKPGDTFGPRNTPTLLNQGLRADAVFWDGRLAGRGAGPFVNPLPFPGLPPLPDIVSAQAMLPVLIRHEMRGDSGDLDVFGNPNELAVIPDNQPAQVWQAIMQRLVAIPQYVALFAAAYPNVATAQLQYAHVARAIGAFQTAALTRAGSPFDQYLAGDNNALTPEQKAGAQLFVDRARCIQCHNGPLLGGQSFANVGVPQLGPGTGTAAPFDEGRGAVFGEPFARFTFRIQPLRNVELTAPYFHNGAFPTLDAVVRHYNDARNSLLNYNPATHLAPAFQSLHHPAAAAEVEQSMDFRVRTPLNLSNTDIAQLVAFLESLTDESARDLSGLVPASVPSGLPVR